jgi:hypothetical protein
MKRIAGRLLPLLLPLLGLLGVTLIPASAQAQVVIGNREDYRSSQLFALELRFGPYSPNVDEEFDGAKTPHRDYFGKKTRVLTQLEFDYQFFRGFGSAAVGVVAGYFHETAHAPLEPEMGGAVDYSKRSEGDTSRLTLYPLSVVLVYRADQLFRRFGIPVVPYGKAGLNYTFWSVYDANDKVVESTGALTGRGRGGTRGWQAAVGASLVLDFLDSGAARALDAETGINHTHLFFELTKFQVSGLGQKNRLHLSDNTWVAGLLFEM